MKRFVIILCWLMVLVPTVIIGVVAFRLVRYEQERLEASTLKAYQAELATVSDNMMLAIADVTSDLIDRLVLLDEASRLDVLRAWQQGNPLIRNVFILRNGHVEHPDSARAATREEASFLMRYDALFDGRRDWSRPPPENGTGAASDSAADRSLRVRREIKQLVNLDYPADAETQVGGTESGRASGWIPWFADNQLHHLVWVEKNGVRYGVELETMALLSRLIRYLPPPPHNSQAYALLDGEERMIHQTGTLDASGSVKKRVRIPAGDYLPHWTLVLFDAGKTDGATAALRYVSYAAMLAVMLVAVVSGGSILMIQAQRSRRDATRKTTFVSNVSHELKTPLTSIRMYAELLEDGRVRDETKKKAYLETIVSESHRLTRLVNNVLDFSRLEQGRVPFALTEFDLGNAVRKILDTYSVRLECGVHGVQETANPVMIRCDRDALEQIMVNLLENARKYAAEGGPPDVQVEAEADTVRIHVMDRGPGIAHKHRKRIFESFYRIDDSLNARSTGSGLGLSISRRLARLFGGDLVYEPRKGGGAIFTLRIPRSGGPR